MKLPIEACIECVDRQSVRQSVANALAGGADRIELCRNMEVDGLTPDATHIEVAREIFGTRRGVLAMIRPRASDFYYNSREIEFMCEEIVMAAEAGADGVVLGVVKDSQVDENALDQLLGIANHYSLAVTFHRAFDEVEDKRYALELLIDKKVRRVLTSGAPLASCSSALEAVTSINCTIAQANGLIEVVVGGGVTSDNVLLLLENMLQGKMLFERLKRRETFVSLHSYSGLCHEGFTSRTLVSDIVKKTQHFLLSKQD